MMSLTPSTSTNEPSKHFVVGYGSLMNASSVARTLSHAPVLHPVKVRGVKRLWCYRSMKRKYTALGCYLAHSDHEIVGVLVDLESIVEKELNQDQEAALKLLDEREAGYERCSIPLDQIQAWDNSSLSIPLNSKIWIYIVPQGPRNKSADYEYPLAQSYVDVVLLGCKSVGGDSFARAFLATTEWPDGEKCCVWIEDRENARYLRPFMGLTEDLIRWIDSLLENNVPFSVTKRRKGSIEFCKPQ